MKRVVLATRLWHVAVFLVAVTLAWVLVSTATTGR